MAQSIALSREGLELGRAFGMRYGRPHINQLIGELNLALALAGSGQPDEAAAIYRDMSAEIRQLALYLRPYLVGAGLSTLGILGEASDPVPEATIVGLKELLVAESYGAAAGSPAEVASAEVQLFASILQWRATIPGFDATRDTLVTQWYRFDPGVDGWSALPLVSGPQTLGAEGLFGQFYPDAGEDAYWGNSNAMLRDVPPTCIRPGRYRLELYLNGRLQATAEADSPAEAYTPHLARDVGVAMCQPPDWTPSGVVPGISTGVVAPDGSRGVAVFRVYEPRTPTGPDSRVTALERVVASGQEGLPEGIGIGFALDPTTEPTIFGRNDGVWRLHAYPGGLAKTSATLVGSGTVLVVCAYGPEAWIVSAEAEALILSLITH
jgi:hypothetical protein